MLPPPASRQASYVYTLPRRASSNRRIPSLAPSHYSQQVTPEDLREDHDGEEEEAELRFEGRLEMEEDLEGMGEERGLEETLEKLGFGAYQWRLLALCGFGWMSDNSALQCIGEEHDPFLSRFDTSWRIVVL